MLNPLRIHRYDFFFLFKMYYNLNIYIALNLFSKYKKKYIKMLILSILISIDFEAIVNYSVYKKYC